MNYFDEVSTSYRQSIEIASNYLVRKGYPEPAARDQARLHVISLLNAGERRPLVVANKAISEIEYRASLLGPVENLWSTLVSLGART
jgi:hypothetical protein